MTHARFPFLIVIIVVLCGIAGCAGGIHLDSELTERSVARLERLYAEAELLLVPVVRDGAPIDAAVRLRLVEIRREAIVLYENLKRSAVKLDGGRALLLRLAGSLLEVLP